MYPEFEDDTQATPDDAVREYARNAGMDNPDQCWLLTYYDTWVRNPYYRGPEVRHPDDYNEDDYNEVEVTP